MDSERERIQADLRGLVQGEVYCDDVHTQLYATDASLYQVRPLGVVRPKHAADVAACVKYAAEQQLPVHARGAGTGLAGESLGRGLVLDFAHTMRRVVHVDGDKVRVQPGVVHAQLNRLLAPHGRVFGPDPAMSTVTTMGSVLALDSAGSHWLRYKSARSKVVSLQVVLASGAIVEVGREPISPEPTRRDDESAISGASGIEPVGDTASLHLVRKLADLLRREAPVIAAHRPRSWVNRSGYHLYDVLGDTHVDLARLLVGSEGTLALITEATLQTDPLPRAQSVALLFFDRLDAAARAALEAGRLGVSACDLMDRRLLSIARETDPRFAQLIPADAEAMLLIEQLGDGSREVRDHVREIVDRLHRVQRLAFDSRIAAEREEIELFWRLPNQVVSRLYSLGGASRPVPFVEDFAVPPEMLPDFIVSLQNVLKAHQTTATLFGHAGHGQLHVRPFLDLRNPDEVRKMQDLAADLYREVWAVGGTISGEHGDGLSRSWFVQKQYGPLYDVFRAVKQLFDPQNLLNPGKVVAELPQPLTTNLRPPALAVRLGVADEAPARLAENQAETPQDAAAPDENTAALPLVQLELNWRPDELVQASLSCNGCGHCRTQLPDSRMCPVFKFSPREEATPRAKSNLLRGVLVGQLAASELAAESLKAVADLCVHCHQCRLECPASVDIPKLVVETKAQYIATRGLPSSDWFFTRLDRLAAWAAWVQPLANWMLRNRQMRWLMEKLFSLSQSRKLPQLAPRNFLRAAARRRWTRPPRHGGRRVLYFVDTYANWFDTQLAEAVVRVLSHNGVAVYVHPGQLASGMPAIVAGDVVRVAGQVRENIELLADAVRQGYTIVASEPAAALCLKREYPQLIDDDDSRLVADNTDDVCSYLWRLHEQGRLELDLRPVNATVGYHLPCHVRAMSGESAGERLLRLIPGLIVQHLDKGCSGMAGTWGLKKQNFRGSLRAGWNLIAAMRAPALPVGTTECSTCKLQMEQGTTKPTLHPIKLLALAYGLMPEIAALLDRRGEELVST